ncbi:peptidoglycan editing factor PgeF [Streptomyces sp. H10-C2]|uniref:peptidoglycan editing factor PgeF n=1 Tax=unclassified Streptomyces TaxID=2593676 RepID=UPI0024BBB5E3|nr:MULTISPECIES: peptidoglycan editing factor PgeF [unclassified Streptomyces]MDJ0343764.1 peptidoglycan editing factor PgeF [Streptomyces sp. PH10-H1]MDJ0373285.1 peptidoglycan editing factor PgeF [Streptomyces sp. H10-C2]
MELAAQVRYAVTDRHGGVSRAPYDSRNLGAATGDDPAAVRRNRELTAYELELDASRVVLMRQVHSATVADVTAPFGPDAPPVDGIVTSETGLALGVLAADCAPVLLADPVARIIGAVHSGRVGTAAGVVPAAVDAMRAKGADPARMVAFIGPTACGDCYEVPDAMREEVCATVPEAWATTSRGTAGLDVRAGIAGQLTRAGVAQVRHDQRCTLESKELFSYRREQRTGRFAAFVWLTR